VKLLRVIEQTVANYEKGNTTKAVPAEVALRQLYLAHVAGNEDTAQELRDHARDMMLPSRRSIRRAALR